jgi:hypothetical protein
LTLLKRSVIEQLTKNQMKQILLFVKGIIDCMVRRCGSKLYIISRFIGDVTNGF